MPSKCFASWASPNWTHPPRRRDKNRSCSDQPQNPPPYLLGVTGHNVKHAVAARASDPTRKREQSLQRELTHVGKGIERLLNAYQEGLLSIEQLRERMPVLRQRQQTLRAELQAMADQTNDRAAFLRLAETLTAFLARLRSGVETLSVIERQRIVRLLVKDVLVGEDTITIRHSIPIPSRPPQNGGSQSP